MKKKTAVGEQKKAEKGQKLENGYFKRKLFSAKKRRKRLTGEQSGEDKSHLFQNKQIFGTLNNFFRKRKNQGKDSKIMERNTEGYNKFDTYGSSPLIKNLEKAQKKNFEEIRKIFDKMSEGKKTHRKILSSTNTLKQPMSNQKQISSFPKGQNSNIFKSLDFQSSIQPKQKQKKVQKNTKKNQISHQRYMSMNLPKPDFTPLNNKNHPKLVIKGLKSPKTSKQKSGPISSFSVNSYKNFENLIDEDRVSIYFNRIMRNKSKNENSGKKISKVLEYLNFSFFGLYEGFNGNFCANFFKEHFHKTLLRKLEKASDGMVYGSIKESISDVQKEYFKACEQVGVGDMTSTSASIFFTLGNFQKNSIENKFFYLFF